VDAAQRHVPRAVQAAIERLRTPTGCHTVASAALEGADEDDEEEGKLPGIKTHTFDGMDVRARPRARCGAPFTTPNADAADAARSPRTAPAPGCHRATPGV